MSKQFHFTSSLTASGELVLPQEISQQISRGEPINVTLTIHTAVAPYPSPSDKREPDSLEALVEAIKKTPPNPHAITPAQGNLAEALRILLEEARANPQSAEERAKDLAFLDAFEAQMKIEEAAHEEEERYELTLLTTDKDFTAVVGLSQENWR